MFRNYFKTAVRNLLRYKGFSFINISGLAVGMASAILILLWIVHETSYDNFHEKRARIYNVWNKATFSGKLQCWPTTPKVMGKSLQQDIPGVEQVTRVDWPGNRPVSFAETKLTSPGTIVDSNFLQVFSFPLLQGDKRTALNDMHAMIVTGKLAKKLFGNENPVGKTARLENKDNFTITGVLKDIPTNTLFRFEYLLPWSYLRSQGNDDPSWDNNSTATYVLLKENTSLASANEKIKKLKLRYSKEEDPAWELFLYPMSRWHLYSNFTNGVEDGGRITVIRMFGLVPTFLLLIACINFMNLSTARSDLDEERIAQSFVSLHP